jgi:WD40 repeat protein
MLRACWHANAIGYLAFSPCGASFAAAGESIAVWDAATWRRTTTLGSGKIYSMAYSPDGVRILATFCTGALRIWDARSGKLVAMHASKEPVRRAFFLTNANIVISTIHRLQKWDVVPPAARMLALLAAALRPHTAAYEFLRRDAARDICRLVFAMLG